jgi:hypothetical protein
MKINLSERSLNTEKRESARIIYRHGIKPAQLKVTL